LIVIVVRSVLFVKIHTSGITAMARGSGKIRRCVQTVARNV